MFEDFQYMAMMWTQMVMGPVLLAVVFAPIIIYLVGRWRAHRDNQPDPYLGIKTILAWFHMASYQLLLSCSAIFLYAVLADLPDFATESMVRTSIGFALPAALIFAVHTVALTRTNSAERPNIQRMFAGVSLAQTSVVAFVGLLMGGFLLLQKNTPTQLNRLAIVIVVVYGGAWVAQIARFFYMLGGNLPEARVQEPATEQRTGAA